MTKMFRLDFHDTQFTVPKSSLFDLFEHHPELVSKASYVVQSSVPPGTFEVFVKALEAGTKVPVTKDNAGHISLLAKEFSLVDLLAECSALQMAAAPELIAALSERLSKVEQQISLHPLAIIAELKTSVANHDGQLQSLRSRISALETNQPVPQADLTELQPVSPDPVFPPIPIAPVSSSEPLTEVELPLQAANSVDGIISYLTRKHGGNVHDKGVITLASKSAQPNNPGHAVWNAADLTTEMRFFSKDDPGQWVYWDFHEKRVRPTHYTIRAPGLRSWVIEGSLDGVHWTEIDKKTDNSDLKEDPHTASFVVSRSDEFRVIRLIQTGKNQDQGDRLVLVAFELFGALLE
jgi:hypothetical protein